MNLDDIRLDKVIKAFKELGGKASYKELYETLDNQNGKLFSNNKNPHAKIRQIVEYHSSDSKAYKGKSDIFFNIQHGRWALRNYDSNVKKILIGNQQITIKKVKISSQPNTPSTSNGRNSSSEKIDYDSLQKKKTKIGSKGEQLVLEIERNRLKAYPDLYKKIKQVSAISDDLGYDILSFEKNGEERHIEVKSTNRKETSHLRFELSRNEYDKSKQLKNYWIYRVFNVNEMNPTIIPIKNPLTSKTLKTGVSIQPSHYSIDIKVN